MKARVWSWVFAFAVLALAITGSATSQAGDALLDVVAVAPTSQQETGFRPGAGRFHARRTDTLHAGVDLIARQGAKERQVYEVLATAGGLVAYSQINGSATYGYGYTVVVDHGNGFYSQYSHLAITASRGLVTVGDHVLPGQRLGYMADPAASEWSSGNVWAKSVAAHHRIQLHYEVFASRSGKTSTTTLAALKSESGHVDPTERLLALGYKDL